VTTDIQPAGRGGGAPSPTGLADVIDTILDKGLVIDAYVWVALAGIEVVTVLREFAGNQQQRPSRRARSQGGS
jgi:Gas vesicle protein